MNKLYYVEEITVPGTNAGSKARADIDKILNKTCISIYSIKKGMSKWEKIKFAIDHNNMYDLIKLSRLKNKYIFIQYPFYTNIIMDTILKKLPEKNNVFLMVHDVDSLRKFNNKKAEDEIEFFNKCKTLVVHNKCMNDKLKELGVKTQMIDLMIFDYLIDKDVLQNSYCDDLSIAFAGNLGKSDFLYNDNFREIDVRINLYGSNLKKEKNLASIINYCGSYNAGMIPYKIKGTFGLVWDGDKLTECSGQYGEYLKYNNPHKFSLYVAAGLIPIVWSKSALSDIVLKNNIGIVVDSLYDLHDIISNLTLKAINEMRKNLNVVRLNVINGLYTEKAINEAAGEHR